jgi:hypothetical protein
MSQDAVAEVAKRLHEKQISVSNTILEKTRSELRGLEFRNPYGTFQKGDNGRKRICALLEYVAREEEGITVPIAQLAAVAFMKEADFKKFHEKVGNFRTQKQKKLQTSDDKSLIPFLAMKLGSFMADSNGVALRAQRLLGDLARHYRKNTDQMRDMVEYARTYEAACFYIVATQDLCEDDKEETQLKASTVVNLSPDISLSEFTSVEEHVRQLVRDMKEKEEISEAKIDKEVHEGRKKRKTSGVQLSRTSDPRQPENPPGRTTKRSKQAATAMLGLVEDRARALECMADDSFSSRMTAIPIHDPSYSPSFVAWKDAVVSQAIQVATKEIHSKALDDDATAVNISRDQALERAVWNLLQSYGY